MPVRLTDSDGNINYLVPAPFINISKAYQKTGDGEIIGATYSITLSGKLLADRGSPKKDGSFAATEGAAGLQDLDSSGSVNDEPEHLWYTSLQNKQKALARLFSKKNEGSYLEVDNEATGGSDGGFKAFVKFESLDLPGHNPGNPYVSDYSVTLTADYLLGPDGTATDDEDDWERLGKWLVSSASESWSIAEGQNFVYDRHDIQSRTGGTEKGDLLQQRKTYEVTRNISATGKSKFDRSTTKGDGLEGTDYNQKYAKNGRAWQQARGYVYDIIQYGGRFLFGDEAIGGADTEYTGATPTGDSSALSADPDDIHLFAMNLPVPNNTTDAKDRYKAYNYKRLQNVDPKGGSFSVTETWTLAPVGSSTLATETIDFSISEDPSTGLPSISVNGAIVGVVDNADEIGVGNSSNPDRSITRKEDVTENYRSETAAGATKSKYENALAHYHAISPFIYTTAKSIITDLNEYGQLTLNPIPRSKSVSQQVGTGTITYSMSFDCGRRYITPYVKAETFDVSDAYPGRVAAQHTVLGRRLGPVLQDIGTQTAWQRTLNISVTVDTRREKICVDNKNQLLWHIGDTTTCTAQAATNSWIDNPNYVDFYEEIMTVGKEPIKGGQTGLSRARPSYVNIQQNALSKLIDAFDPYTYREGSLGGTSPSKNVRKSYSDPPSESWNPETGQYSYSITWTYEINDPWQFATTDYLGGANDDSMYAPYPGLEI